MMESITSMIQLWYYITLLYGYIDVITLDTFNYIYPLVIKHGWPGSQLRIGKNKCENSSNSTRDVPLPSVPSDQRFGGSKLLETTRPP